MDFSKTRIRKAVNFIKREGLIGGTFKLLRKFPDFLKAPQEGDILFITGGIGASALYRAHHAAEELLLHGFKCSVLVQDNPFLANCAGRFKIFIFQKTAFTPGIKKLIHKIKEKKREIIFETDDLTFDPQYFFYSEYYKRAGESEKKVFEREAGREILTDLYVKTCTTTTSYLADILKTYNKKVFIVPNKLSDKDLEIISNLTDNKQPATDNKIHIGYFSGTRSHDKDFATIAGPLIKIMEKYPSVELFLAGPLDIGEGFNKFKNRIKKLPYVSRRKHFKNIANVDINLAPLEIGNPFCESKSELKFFEAGILGVPTVAAETRTFKEAISDGVDGFTAVTEDEWRDKMEKLVTDNNLRIEIGRKAREKVLKNYTNKNSRNEEYYNYLRSKL